MTTQIPMKYRSEKLLPDPSSHELSVTQHNLEKLQSEGRPEVQATRQCDDGIPWLHIAEKILAGEWANADGSTCKSLLIGLRGIRNPLCLQAVEALERIHENSTGMKTEPVNGTKIFNERTN